MAIVDTKHTQTIEELVSKLGEGGSGGGGETSIGPTPKWSFKGTFADLVKKYPIQFGTFKPDSDGPTYYQPYIVLSDDYIGDKGDYVVFGDAELALDSKKFVRNEHEDEYIATWFYIPGAEVYDPKYLGLAIITNRNDGYSDLKSFGIDDKITVLTPCQPTGSKPNIANLTYGPAYTSEEEARTSFTNLAAAIGDKPFNIAVYDKSTSLYYRDVKIKIAKFTSTYEDNVTKYSCNMPFSEMVEVFNHGGLVIGVNEYNRHVIFQPGLSSSGAIDSFMFRYDDYSIAGTNAFLRINQINVYKNGNISNYTEFVTVTGTK